MASQLRRVRAHVISCLFFFGGGGVCGGEQNNTKYELFVIITFELASGAVSTF